ncbi:hypothetical protein J3458_002896 [Metarhizium acridum]|uniref:uncharacterized protein n=1 Tax=Metarhizium acridum TaxID=92637 RepID=UPI001C6A9F57|nr:hypothetical protein J3458_002896 [Metarhizium acridum]
MFGGEQRLDSKSRNAKVHLYRLAAGERRGTRKASTGARRAGNVWLAVVTLEGATVVLDDLTFRKGKKPIGYSALRTPTRRMEKDKKAKSSRINNSDVVQVSAV